MRRKVLEILAAGIAMSGGLPEVKVPASIKRSIKDRRKVAPPRSMTPEELAYYQQHKTLNGFKP